LDAERCAIAFFGTRLELSRYEYRLLAVLIEKPGRVWSRERLMEKAWDEPEASLERTVDAHIKSLRAKLRQIRPDAEAIVTHRGLGYSLKEDW
jgi:two-component system catabolic regulation response regulator CreB